VRLYSEDQDMKPPKEQRGFRKIAEDVEAEHNRRQSATNKIHLSWQTVRDRYSGTSSITQSCADEAATFAPEEAEVLARYAIKMSSRGFGLSLQRLRQLATKLLIATGRPPPGKNWLGRFVSTHATLRMHWAQHLEAKRRKAVNPASHNKWFTRLGAILTGNIPDKFPDLQEDYPDLTQPINAELIFGLDKTNFQTAPTQKERVVGPVDQKVHQQRKGSRETITVVATICANETALKPEVIFKGQHFLVSWAQKNPLNASYAVNHLQGSILSDHILGLVTRKKAGSMVRLV
jgi:hypothetical protein